MEARLTCRWCPNTCSSDNTLRRHYILKHRHIYRPGRSPVYIVDDAEYERLCVRKRRNQCYRKRLRRLKAATAAAAPLGQHVAAGPAGQHGGQTGQHDGQVGQGQTSAGPRRSASRSMEAPLTCSWCPRMTFKSDRSVCQHYILIHRHIYRPGQSPVYIVDDAEYERLCASQHRGKGHRNQRHTAAVAAPLGQHVAAGPADQRGSQTGQHDGQVGQGQTSASSRRSASRSMEAPLTCSWCPRMTFSSDRSVCRHYILIHRHIYRPGQSPVYIVDDAEYERLCACQHRGKGHQNQHHTAAVAAPLGQHVAAGQHGGQTGQHDGQVGQGPTRVGPRRSASRSMEAPLTCSWCPRLTFNSDRSVCRHYILIHRHIYRPGHSPVYIVDDAEYERLCAQVHPGKGRRHRRHRPAAAAPLGQHVAAGPAGQHGGQTGQHNGQVGQGRTRAGPRRRNRRHRAAASASAAAAPPVPRVAAGPARNHDGQIRQGRTRAGPHRSVNK